MLHSHDHHSHGRRPHFAAGVLLAGAAVALMFVGCATDGTTGIIVAERLTRSPDRLPASIRTALYFHDERGETWCILSDLTRDEILAGTYNTGQFVRIEWLWSPRPGSTPMDRDATNVSIRQVIVANGEVGVFEGGGFALPASEPGQREWSIELRNATLALVESSTRFHDKLTPARLTGSFTATLEIDEARRVRNAISQRITDLLDQTWRAGAGEAPNRAGAFDRLAAK